MATLAARPQESINLAGEYSLYVSESSDSLVVQWLTTEPVPGFIRATAQGKVVLERETPPGTAHRAAFRVKDQILSLQYGSRADQYVTVIDRKPPRRAAVQEDADSIYVLGDTHGEYDSVVRLLQITGLIDDSLRWAGSRKRLVLLGDVADRGPDVTKLFWLLYRLEREAEQQQGRVHLLLGNHEIMVMLGDVRYVHGKEQHIARLHEVGYARMFDPRASILGRWLSTKPGMLKIDRLLFVHGGVSSDYAKYTVQAHADSVRAQMGRELFYAQADTSARIQVDSLTLAHFEDFFWGERSVFWYRGYAESDTLRDELDRVLRHFKADIQLVGHTAQEKIHQKYDGKLILAHPKQPGTEILLLTRGPSGFVGERIALNGERESLGE
jgi:hypothetical protein